MDSTTYRNAICVPLRDERRNVAGLIRSIAAQDAAALADTVIVLCLDGDDPAARAAAALVDAPLLHMRVHAIPRGEVPDAGRARRAALDAGLALLAGDGALLIYYNI